MEPILLTLTLATLGELLIQALKPALQPLLNLLNLPADIDPYLYLSLLLGVALALIYRVDLLAALGIGPWTLVGCLTSGLFIGRGANFVHDALAALQGIARSLRSA